MSTILRFLPALACAGVMFICMRGMMSRSGPSSDVSEPRDEEIARLRSEVEDLRSRLDPSTADRDHS
jgi:hypothetical protein